MKLGFIKKFFSHKSKGMSNEELEILEKAKQKQVEEESKQVIIN